jgi:AcrR family transcriptional regulator
MGAGGPGVCVQRVRIRDAMVLVVGEYGFAGTTVGGVCACAGVSRRSFYECFDGLRDCFLAVIDEGYRRAHELICLAFEGEDCWREGVSTALGLLLGLFDDEPMLARVWFVETLAAGSWALERRGCHVAALTATIVERWPVPEGTPVNPLAAVGVMESVLGILHTRLLMGAGEPLVGLLGPLMGIVSAPYVGGAAAVVEIERGEARARGILAGREPRLGYEGSCEVQIPSTLRDPRAHRARECLRYLAQNPGVSNREVAAAVGIRRQEQISRLLARLHALGLLVKPAAPRGAANAWSLTPYGLHVCRVLLVEYTPVFSVLSGGD